MSGLSRDDENWRNSLLKRQAEPGDDPLRESEQLWLSILNDRYEKFLEEGLQAMKSQLPSSKGGPTFATSMRESVSSFFGKVGKGMKFASLSPDGSPTGDSFSSATGAQQQNFADFETEPPHPTAKHWSWVIKDKLIVGGIPLADPQISDPSGHIRGVRAQCKERGVKVGLVVSCIDTHGELSRQGDRLESFAKPKDWERHLGVSCFAELALPENYDETIIDVPCSDALSACRMMNDIMAAGKAVYLHCKAGKARCWCLAMCFLITQRGMSFDSAQEWLRKMRPQMGGGALHALYVQQVADYAAANPLPEKGSINNVLNVVNTGTTSSSRGDYNNNNSSASPVSPSQLPSSSPSGATSMQNFSSLDQNEASSGANNNNTTTTNNNDDQQHISNLTSPTTTSLQHQLPDPSAGVCEETETKYKELLADLLQLPPIYRIKIVRDLERLT